MRQYVHSEIPRLRWTSDLHRSFINAIHSVGGEKKATPKLIVELMGVNGVGISHVKSHLQMYRNRNKSENCQGNHHVEKHENSRKRSRHADGNARLANLDQELEKYRSSIYSHKRLRACKVQSSFPKEEALQLNDRTCGPYTQMTSYNQQSRNQNDQVKRKFCAQWRDSKKYCRHPTSDSVKSGMEDLGELCLSQYQCSQKMEEQERLIPLELQLKDSLCYQHGKFTCGTTSIYNNKQESRASPEEKDISCSTSNDAQSVLIDNVWRVESKDQDDARSDKKPMLREDDIRLELSISIS
ncbi:hypothetical protein SUGI_0982690 [Cryptomeria japonica]|uniref:two-component response regulator ORR26 n=1 Tax=Cryptomeria japonica TaxID=3369 RepID=UPI0024149340|nr:two-component response regulator ORR26 [Cryptomeria japonica]GLJ46635.1 hypothetical protein SUGI_0982690 [Cryptomeria japonica]